jgi:hypothetical protein
LKNKQHPEHVKPARDEVTSKEAHQATEKLRNTQTQHDRYDDQKELKKVHGNTYRRLRDLRPDSFASMGATQRR